MDSRADGNGKTSARLPTRLTAPTPACDLRLEFHFSSFGKTPGLRVRSRSDRACRDGRVAVTVVGIERFRIVHISIQRAHVHMLVEANDKLALARRMQGFQISAARNINTVLGVDRFRRRRGHVFADRYHVEVITSPRRAHHALSYVLNNWRKHREDQRGLATAWLVDPFSSGVSFPGWKELDDRRWMWPLRATYDPLVVYQPRSWLLREGWKCAGPISARDVPSKRRDGGDRDR
jgi:REP element-mobilizing transposase RayT